MTDSKDLIYSEETKEIAKVNSSIESEKVLNIVINSLRGIFPSWRNAIKTQVELDNLKKEWLTAFIANKINTDAKINKGLSIARKSTSPFIPSLGQFIEWCKVPNVYIHIELDNLKHVDKTPPSEVTKMLKEKCPWYKSKKYEPAEQEQEQEKSDRQVQYDATGTYKDKPEDENQ